MSVLMVIPVIDPAFSLPCLQGMHPSVWPHVLVVDNSAKGISPSWVRHFPGLTIWRTAEAPHNLGVARAWNVALDHARGRGVDKLLLVSAQVRWGSPGAVDFLELAERSEHVECPTPPMWHTASMPLAVLDRVGRFDENFYPAYFEDVDIIRRLRLAGLTERYGNDPQGWGTVIDAVAPRDGHGVDKLRGDHPGRPTFRIERLAYYWARKWAIHDHNCVDTDPHNGHVTPFGDPDHGLDYWPACTVEELWERYDIVGH